MWFFYGSEGIVADSHLFDTAGNLVKTFEGKSENHFANFLRAVRSRKHTDLNADILEGHQSSALCHIANISYRLGHTSALKEASLELGRIHVQDKVEETFERTRHYLEGAGVDLGKTPVTMGALLQLDGDTERFSNNANANRLLSREYRAPFVLPSESSL